MISSNFFHMPAIFALGIAFAITPYGHPQQAVSQTHTRFEVASIRRDLNRDDNTHIDINKGRLTITNAPLKTLIRNAYDLQSFQFSGGPSWLETNMYDITATTGTGQEVTNDEYKILLQNLLADRFGLKVHWETRQGTVYALVIAKGGPKIKETPRKGAASAPIEVPTRAISRASANPCRSSPLISPIHSVKWSSTRPASPATTTGS